MEAQKTHREVAEAAEFTLRIRNQDTTVILFTLALD